jgi:hypothetical protein
MAFPAVKNGFERGKRSSGRREFDPRAGPCRPLSSGEDLGTEYSALVAIDTRQRRGGASVRPSYVRGSSKNRLRPPRPAGALPHLFSAH